MRALPVAVAALLCLGLSACGARPAAPPAEQKVSVPETPKPPEKPIEATWPTYHGAPSLDGVADVMLPDALEQAWHFEAEGAVENTPVAGGGRICFVDIKGTIYALDLGGKLAWSRNFHQAAAEGKPAQKVFFDAPLAIFEGVVIAASSGGHVYALNATDGTVKWETSTEVPFLGSPNLAEVIVEGKPEKRVYLIDQENSGLMALRFSDGARLWSTPGRDRCDASPAATSSLVAFGSCASAVHMFAPDSGKMLREVPLEQDSQIAGGVVLLGDDLYSGARSGEFFLLNTKTGEKVWKNAVCEGEIFSTPAVSADHVVFGANDSVLYCLKRKTGELLWKQEMRDTPLSPVIARDKVIVSANGQLHLLRLVDGAPLWSIAVSDTITSPAVVGALVVVGGDDATVTAFAGRKKE